MLGASATFAVVIRSINCHPPWLRQHARTLKAQADGLTVATVAVRLQSAAGRKLRVHDRLRTTVPRNYPKNERQEVGLACGFGLAALPRPLKRAAILRTLQLTSAYSGRLVASYFENLLPRETNKEYYERIRMPVSLKIIERKLQSQEFRNMSELESYFKRMVTNAKEFYPKNSEVFEDAERVRKALSNYMTKTNPAYKLLPNYSCQAAPIPEDSNSEPEDLPAHGSGEEDADGEDEDAEGEDDVQSDEDEGDEDEGDEAEDGASRKIVLKRRGLERPARAGSEQARKMDRSGRVKADHEYEGVPYKGLSFQQAQEKIVEELIRKPDGP